MPVCEANTKQQNENNLGCLLRIVHSSTESQSFGTFLTYRTSTLRGCHPPTGAKSAPLCGKQQQLVETWHSLRHRDVFIAI